MATNHGEFYRGVEAARAAAARVSPPAPATLAAAVHAAVDALANDLGSATAHACRAGCSHCCHYPVGVTFGEARRLAHAVQHDPHLRERVVAAAAATAARAWHELVGEPCPLLVAGRCAVYAARPVPCRSLASGDADACAAALADAAHQGVPRDEAAFWRGLGATAALVDLSPGGLRELRASVASLLRHDDPAAFAACRPAG